MKNILVENMLRFGVKNLSESSMKVLLEQSLMLLNFKYGENPDMLPAPQIGKMAGKLTNTQNEKAAEVNKNLQSQLQELQSHPAYKVLITALGDSGYVTQNTKIWCWKLSHDVRKAFLDQTQEWLSTKEGQRALKKQNKLPILAHLARGESEKKVTPGEPQPGFPGFTAPLSIAGATVYKDNSIEIDSALQQEIDRWVSEVQAAINEAKQVNPNATIECVKVDIASSCSRLRNTGAYEGKTWNQLSQDRANNVYNILSAKLKEIGVTMSPKITKVLRGGYNGDGTSGPDPSKDFTLRSGQNTNQMGWSKTGAERQSGKAADSERYVGNYGTLLKSSQESDRYKFCVANVDFIIKAPDGEEPTKPTVEYFRGYTLTLSTKFDTSGAGTQKFPTPKFTRDRNNTSNILTRCPKFSGGENYGIK
jgi:hypothetical protein